MEELYDEFGNFIGDPEDGLPDETRESDDAPYLDEEEEDAAQHGAAHEAQPMDVDDVSGPSNAVILHEDKQYYPSASQVYGQDVEVLVQEADTQTLQQPIVAPVERKKFILQEEGTDVPPLHFDLRFLADQMQFPEQIRNVALMGHIHHGKTSLMDVLVRQTHDLARYWDGKTGKAREERLRYTDTNVLERERGISVKASPMSLLLPATSGKTYMINILDTPGHVNFADEMAAAMRLVDGVILVVDVIEGVQATTELVIKHAVLSNTPLTLFVNKLDRLILELKLPPTDAYFKIKHVVEEVNTVISNTLPRLAAEKWRISPERGNVTFACTSMNWAFTLASFAKLYAEQYSKTKKDFDAQEFSQRLWGDIFFNPASRKFTRRPVEDRAKRSFVHFVLEPIYKLYSHTISESPRDLKETLASLGIQLNMTSLKSNAKDLLNMVCEQFFGPPTALVDMIVQYVPSPLGGARRMLEAFYTGPMNTKTANSMLQCDSSGPLVVHITKLFSTQDALGFQAFGRVVSGTVRVGDKVRVLGEGYSMDDEEDMARETVTGVCIAQSRYQIPATGVPAGNMVLLSGIDNSIVKTATVVASEFSNGEDAYIFKPINHFFESVFKISVAPVNAAELPKVLDGLRKISKSYPLAETKVEESGENVILGTGELYLDCILHDLRKLYARTEIKVSDPVTRFCETVTEQSSVKCYAITANKKNKITFIAEPLDDGIAEDIETGAVSIREPARVVGKFFEENYGYDLLASRNIWAFGPGERGANILQNDTLPSEVDARVLRSVRDGLQQGFAWAAKEGPLCDEPIRNTKFKLTDIDLASEPIHRGSGQIIPTARKAIYSSMLMAAPRLLEPIYSCDVVGPASTVNNLYSVLSRRRGHVLSDTPVPGTPLYRVKGLLPVLDSFGFETDLRIYTQGQATVSLVFEKWSIVPGDPLDKSIKLRALEPASGQALARDFVLKTRRRKGLAEDVRVTQYLEKELAMQLKTDDVLDGN